MSLYVSGADCFCDIVGLLTMGSFVSVCDCVCVAECLCGFLSNCMLT